MSVYKTYKFQDITKLQDHLNGALRGGKDPRKGYWGLVGLQLKFKKPSVTTVTFVGVSGNQIGFLSFADVKSQVETAVAGLKVFADGEQLVFVESTPSNGVELDTSSALEVLGFSAGEKSYVYAYPDGVVAAVAPHYITAYPVDGFHVLIVKE
ncbi:MAG: hypothetical protein EBU88_07390 [Acidobacteria bacterium]|nr:hypothetical protein [Acidobacteriota bacterium]